MIISHPTWLWKVEIRLSNSIPAQKSGRGFSDWKNRSITLSRNADIDSHSRYTGDNVLHIVEWAVNIRLGSECEANGKHNTKNIGK